MTLYDFKGGIGTSSRVVRPRPHKKVEYKVGVIAQCNFGTMRDLVVAGVPVGMYFDPDAASKTHPKRRNKGSIIAVIATDAPLLPHHLKRLARRATHGIARTGAISEDTSGDLFVAFSTSTLAAAERVVDTETFNALFEGVVHATEEAVINALVAAETMRAPKGRKPRYTYDAIDVARLRRYLRKHHRLIE